MRHLVLITLAFLLVIRLTTATADPTALANESLVGLWGDQRVFGPLIHGELTIDGRMQVWRAGISGVTAQVKRTGNAVQFTLPDNLGQFRGHIQQGAKLIEGFWIQPPGITLNNAYATPIQLHTTQHGVWQGQVTPLTDHVSLYILISRAANGTLNAYIRNPEFNFAHGRLYRVVADGNGNLTFVNTKHESDRLRASYDADTDRLVVTVQGVGVFDFTRRDTGDAPGFYPRTPTLEKYQYRQPVHENDGWDTASLTAVGIDPQPIAQLMNWILNTRINDNAPYIQSLLIARQDKLALEEYFYGFDRARTHDTRSAGKTFTSVLVGLAMEHGAKFNLHTSVYSLFPEYKHFANPDPRKNEITVEDLLTMTSGLACDDYDEHSPGNEDNMQSQSKQPDWYKYTLDLPMARDPGGVQAVYCSAGVNLLGGIVHNTTGVWLPTFFETYLARPLDIRTYHMNLMPTGDAYMAGGIYLRPRDMLKLGQLYLSGGVWHGRRVISKQWVKVSTSRHSQFSPDHGYGFTWHLHQINVDNHSYSEYAAEGNGGQFIMVIPELDMTVVITAGNYGAFDTWYKFQQLVPQYVIPAVLLGEKKATH